MNKQISFFWLFPVIILSGIFGFLTSSYSYFHIKNEIDIVNLIGIIVTATIGIYIASSLQNSIEAKKFEKELIHGVIRSLSQKTKTIDKYLAVNSLRFKETVKSFKDISSLISELKELNEICALIDQEKIIELRSSFTEIKPLITGSPKDADFLVLSIEHKILSKKKIDNLKRNLLQIMIKINRK